MMGARQDGQKRKSRPAAKSNHLDQIQNLYISEGRFWFYAGIIAAMLTFLFFLGGLVAWLTGIVTQGWVASIASTAPGLITALFFNRDKAAHEKIETVRISLEKQQEEERKRREQELEDKRKQREQELEDKRKQREQELEEERKRREQEASVSYLMLKLEAYYKLASKTDDEDQRKIYYHELFGPAAEYNKRRLEAYFDTVSQMEDENTKKAFFREMFSSLLIKAEEIAVVAPSH